MDPELTHFTQLGGGTFGSKDIFWPFALLKAFPHGIILKSFGHEYLFDKSQIVELIEYSGKTTSGIQIKHNIEGYPKHIIFWTLNITKLKKYFYLLGFIVKE